VISSSCCSSPTAEAWFVQATMMGGVAADRIDAAPPLVPRQPFHTGVGGLRPVAMERTLEFLEGEATAVIGPFEKPCDTGGRPHGG
jgi:hypothetical protein